MSAVPQPHIEMETSPVPDPSPSLFQMSLDLIAVAGFDGYYKKVNPVMTDLLGWTWEELRSRPLLDFVHPDDREKTKSEFSRVKHHGVSIMHFENRMVTKSGDFRWISWKAQPDVDSKLIFSTGRDVTAARKKTDISTSVNLLLQRIESLENQNTQILMTRRPITRSTEQVNVGNGDTDEDLQIAAGIKKGRVWWKVLAWVFGVLTMVVGTVFGAGVAYQQYTEDNATKSDIEKLEHDRVEPLEKHVEDLDDGMDKVSKGVDSLVHTQEQEKEVKKVKRLVDRHDKQYQQALQEYTADKAARRPAGPRPQKTPEHIKLEDQLAELEGKL